VRLVLDERVRLREISRKLQLSGLPDRRGARCAHYPRWSGRSQFFSFSKVVAVVGNAAAAWARKLMWRGGSRACGRDGSTTSIAGSDAKDSE